MAADKSQTTQETEFNWKGEAGEKFAEWNKPDADGKDAQWLEFFNTTLSDTTERVIQALEKHGLDRKKAKVLDIGCNTGGGLAIFEKLGFDPDNLYGVDLSDKAIEILKKAHPKYQAQVVSGFDYEVPRIDLVSHCGVLCQIPEEDYSKFFDKIRAIAPTFYMFNEGINPRGYEKIPNSVAHGHHQSHSDGHHGHGHHDAKPDSHDNKEGKAGEADGGVPMDEGYHHTNNFEKVVEQHFPEAKKLFSEKLIFSESAKPWFDAMHMTHSLCNVYHMV